MKDATQLDRIEMLLMASGLATGHVQWVSGWVAGENEGGVMVALFSQYGQFPVCKVYHEKLYQLPDYVANAVPETAAPLPANRAGAERAGRFVECRPFQIVRYAYEGEENAKWRLAGVLRLGKELEAQPAPQPQQTAVSQPTQQPTPAELADSFFRVNDTVEVVGNTGRKRGVVTGFGKDTEGNPLIAVQIEKRVFRLAPDKLIPVALAA